MNAIDEIYEKLEELSLEFQNEIERADNSINENVLKSGRKIDEIINEYYNIRANSSDDMDQW